MFFYVDDLEDNWTFDEPFDFIYGRMLTGSIADWPKFLRQAYESVSPPSSGYLRPGPHLNVNKGVHADCLCKATSSPAAI